MKKSKIIVALFTLIIVSISLFSISVNAEVADIVVVDGIKYVLEETNGRKSAYVSSYAETDTEKSELTEINILSEVNGYPVTSIRAASSKGKYPNVTKVSIPNTVTSIEISAFKGMTNLKTVYLANSVSYIGENAFYGCEKLNYIDISNVTSIGSGAFRNCKNLTKVTLSDELENISCFAFSGTGLKSITIPAITKFECRCDWDETYYYEQFEGCTSLKTVVFEDRDEEEFMIPKNIFTNCTALKKVYLPEDTKITVGPRAFKNCKSLTKVYGSENIVEIGDAAFSYCKSLKEITLGKNLKTVGEKAFLGCTKLARVNLESTKTAPTFGRKAFSATADGIKFVADKAIAKKVKTNLKNTATKNAKVYSVSYSKV